MQRPQVSDCATQLPRTKRWLVYIYISQYALSGASGLEAVWILRIAGGEAVTRCPGLLLTLGILYAPSYERWVETGGSKPCSIFFSPPYRLDRRRHRKLTPETRVRRIRT